MFRACDNPFRVGQIHALAYEDPALDWDHMLFRLKAQDFRGVIVGAHGRGKSTLLHELGTHLEGEGFAIRNVFLNDRSKWSIRDRIRWIQEGELDGQFVLLDGCEQLGPVAWRQFRWAARRASGLVVTTHRPGRLETLFECQTSPGLLDALLARLVPQALPAVHEAAHRLYDEHRGYIRAVWFGLYDRCARGDLDVVALRNELSAPLV